MRGMLLAPGAGLCDSSVIKVGTDAMIIYLLSEWSEVSGLRGEVKLEDYHLGSLGGLD